MILSHLKDWLMDNTASRCILVEVSVFNGQEETTLFLSNRNYTTTSGEVPEHTAYLPCIEAVSPLAEKLDIDGSTSLSLGELTFSNHSGDLDEWLSWVFDNRTVSVFIGDTNWPRQEFEIIYTGIVTTLQIKSSTTLALPITDNLQRLNGAINDELDDDEETLPVCFGEVSNVKPKLIDPVNLVYQVHTRKIGGIIEVRDRGLPVLFSHDLDAGTFQLGSKPFGEVTCSVWGDAEDMYVDTPSEIIHRLATQFGPEPLTSQEVDVDSFEAFNLDNQQCVGMFLDERSNLLEVMTQIASSVGSAVCTSATGRLKIIQIQAPELMTSQMRITEDSIVEDSLRVRSKLEVMSSIKLGYNRNYAADLEMSVGVPTAHQDQFDGEWKFVKVKDDEIISLYRHTKEPVAQLTSLQSGSDALAEATRWFNIFKTQRFIYTLKGYEELLQLELGEAIELDHKKFGFLGGRKAMVIGLSKNWATGLVDVELLA